MGAESVPVGAYTRKVLDGLPAEQREAILANVRSNEPDVAGVVGKVAQGAVDAGFVYVTDVEAAGRRAEGDRPARGPQARGRVRCRRGQGRQAPRAGAAVRRRAARREPAARRSTAPGSCRRRALELVHRAAVGRAGARRWRSSSLPVVAIFVDVGPARAARPRSTTRRARRAVAVAADERDGDRDHRRRRHARRVAAGDAPFRGREAGVTLVELPLVLPPAVAGIGLLAAVGPRGLLGGRSACPSRSRPPASWSR